MRIAMSETWEGIAIGSKGEVKKVSKDPKKLGTLMTVKFDYGETRTVPMAATLSEIIYKKQFE